MDFETLENHNALGTVIKVVGVGGAGNNAVQHMITKGVLGVDFICLNTDAQALRRSSATYKLQLGKTGLGAGARPEVGRVCAEEAKEEIKQLLAGSNMVFITAGMGGGTGTGAAPVVAKIAKEMGILTVGVVSKPFEFEGVKRMNVAENGANELQAHVDSLIIVLNERLFSVMGEDAEMDKCFECADNVLHNAVAGIAEIINIDGLINVDFEDVKTVMSEQGKAMMGTATQAGPDRARLAAEQAVASPLLEGVDLSGARGILVNITATRSLKLSETKQVMNTIRSYAAKDATVILGSVYDESLNDELRVTVVATGLGADLIAQEHLNQYEKHIQQNNVNQVEANLLQQIQALNMQKQLNGNLQTFNQTHMQPSHAVQHHSAVSSVNSVSSVNNLQAHNQANSAYSSQLEQLNQLMQEKQRLEAQMQADRNRYQNMQTLQTQAITQPVAQTTATVSEDLPMQSTTNLFNERKMPFDGQNKEAEEYDIPAFLRRSNQTDQV